MRVRPPELNGHESFYRALIRDVEYRIREGCLVSFQRKGSWSLHDCSIGNEPLRIGARITHNNVIFIHDHSTIVLRFIWTVSLEGYKFVGAFSIDNDSP